MRIPKHTRLKRTLFIRKNRNIQIFKGNQLYQATKQHFYIYSRRPVVKTRAGSKHIQDSEERETQHANLGQNTTCESRTKQNMRI